MTAAQQLPADDHAGADTGRAGHADDVAGPGGGAVPVLGEGRQIRLVVDRERELARADRVAQERAGRDFAPAEVRGDRDVPGLDVDEPGQRQRDPEQLRPARRQLLAQFDREPRDPADHVARVGAGTVDLEAAFGADLAEQVDGAGGQIVDVDLEADRGDAVAVGLEEPPGRPIRPGCSLTSVSRSSRRAISSFARLETVLRSSPVSRATAIRERAPPRRTSSSTRLRFATRMSRGSIVPRPCGSGVIATYTPSRCSTTSWSSRSFA